MKTTRGVQQEEVWEAADALLAAGLRPTIERVRQHLGRGSPNTVSPMVDSWFAGLGKRLGMASDQDGEGQVPQAVAQAMTKLWTASLLVARKEAEAALALEKQALESGTAALAERELSLTLQEQSFTQRQGVVDELLRAERERTNGVEARLEAAQAQLRQRETLITELRMALGGVQQQLQAARENSDELTRSHAAERNKWEERTAGNERRLLGEIERERQAARKTSADLLTANTLLQTTRVNYEAHIVKESQRLQACEVDLSVARQSLASMELRCSELSGLLQEQRATNASTLKQLNQTLESMARKITPVKRMSSSGVGAQKRVP